MTVLNVIEYRSSFVAGMLCCQLRLASPLMI
jgi:hypothetical protein